MHDGALVLVVAVAGRRGERARLRERGPDGVGADAAVLAGDELHGGCLAGQGVAGRGPLARRAGGQRPRAVVHAEHRRGWQRRQQDDVAFVLALVLGAAVHELHGHVVQVDGDPERRLLLQQHDGVGAGRQARVEHASAGDAVSGAAHVLDRAGQFRALVAHQHLVGVLERPRAGPGPVQRPGPEHAAVAGLGVLEGQGRVAGSGPGARGERPGRQVVVVFVHRGCLLLPAEREVGVLPGERDPQPVEADRAEALVHRGQQGRATGVRGAHVGLPRRVLCREVGLLAHFLQGVGGRPAGGFEGRAVRVAVVADGPHPARVFAIGVPLVRTEHPPGDGFAEVGEAGSQGGDQVGAVLLVPGGPLAEEEQRQVQLVGRLRAGGVEGQAGRVLLAGHQSDHPARVTTRSGQGLGIHTVLPCIRNSCSEARLRLQGCGP